MTEQKLKQALRVLRKGNSQKLLSSIPKEVIIESDPNWAKGSIETFKNIRKKRARALLFPYRKQPVKFLTYSLKNSIYIQDKLSSGGSNALLNHFPPLSSTIYKKLLDGGAIHICSSALDEFGMGSAGVFCNTGLIRNPHDENRVCGGSSSGGAYLVSKGLVDFAIGTDTGGSIRTPASYTSLYGFKPSFGLVSREGILPLCTLLDTPSILSTSVEIISRVLSVISGPDPLDLTTLKSQKKNFHKFPRNLLLTYKSEDKPKKLSFVVLEELQKYPVSRTLSQQEIKIKESYNNLINRLNQESNCELFSETLRKIPLDLAELTYKIIAYSEAITHYFSLNGLVAPWSNLQSSGVAFNSKFPVDKKYEAKAREIREKMGREVQLRHLIGYFFLYQSNYKNIYLKARKLMNAYTQNMKRVLSEGKILISPTTPTIAPLLENFFNGYQVDNFSSALLLSNFSGAPAISIPWLEYEAKYYENTSTVYVGLHLTAKRGEDHYLLSAVKYLESNKLL